MITINRTVNLNQLCRVENLSGVVFTGEQGGHEFILTAIKDETVTPLTGSVSGQVRCPDGTAVQLTTEYCDIDDYGRGVVKLAGNCYEHGSGPFGLIVTNVDGNGNRTVIYAAAGFIHVGEDASPVDPENTINVAAIQAIISDMQDAIDDCENAASFVPNIIAPEYSSASTYGVGDYVTHDGKFYRCIVPISTAGSSWGTNAGCFMEVTVSSEMFGLTNAFNEMYAADITNTNSWEVGTIAVITGNNSTSSTRLRMKKYVNAADEVFRIKAKTGYEFMVYAWNLSSGNYIGCLKTSGVFDTSTSNVLWVKEYNIANQPGLKFKVVLRNADNTSASMNVSDGANCLYTTRYVNDDAIAPEFDPVVRYAAGDYALYETEMYRFDTAHTGEWTGADVTRVSAGGEIAGLAGSKMNRIPVSLKNTDDLDAIVTPGFYRWTNANTPANSPENIGCTMIVNGFSGSGCDTQIAVTRTGNAYFRAYNTSSWSDWVKAADATAVDAGMYAYNRAACDAAERMTGIRFAKWKVGVYISTPAEGSTATLNEVYYGPNRMGCVMDIAPGEALYWGGLGGGGNVNRAWAFVNSSNVVLQRSGANLNTPQYVIAPDNAAKVILNNYSTYSGELVSGVYAFIGNPHPIYTLYSTGDATDRTEEIETALKRHGSCVLGPGTYYVTGIRMPDNTSLSGCGSKTKIRLIDTTYTNEFTAGNQTFTYYYRYTFATPLAPGRYRFVADVTSEDTDSTVCLMAVFKNNGFGTSNQIYKRSMPRTTGAETYFVADDPITGIQFNASVDAAKSEGDVASFANISLVREYTAVEMGGGCSVKDMEIAGDDGEYTIDGIIADNLFASNLLRNGIGYYGIGEKTTKSKGIINGCYVHGFYGGGIKLYNTGYGIRGLNISNCYAYYCYAGIDIPHFSEYHRFVGCNIHVNRIGVRNNGGNNAFVGCNMSSNVYGFYMDSEGGTHNNGAHGGVNGCILHHNRTNAIYIVGETPGFVFTGCNIDQGGVYIKDSRGVMFSGDNFLNEFSITIDNSKSINFIGNNMRSTTVPLTTITGNSKVNFANNYDYDGDPVDPTAES